MSDIRKSVESSLQDLGFTHNEAKIYLYLIQHPDSNGYEISKNTGISRSMVYGSLEKLRIDGYIDLTQSTSASYVPKSLAEIAHNFDYKIRNAITNLKENIPMLEPGKSEDLFISIPDKDNQVKKMSYMVKSSKKYLYISAGARELRWIRDDLYSLPKEIEVHLFGLADITEFADRFNVYSKKISSEELKHSSSTKDKWRILIIKDEGEVLICGGESGKIGHAIYTENKMMVTFAIEHFIHDVQLYHIEKEHNIKDTTHLKFRHHKE